MKNIHYSVPDTLVDKIVSVKMYSEKIVIFHGQVKVATQENWGCRTLIARILEKEMEIRVEKRRKQRVRIAGFPQMKYLQELVREDLPKEQGRKQRS